MAEIKTFKISELPSIGINLDDKDMLLVADKSEKNAALSTKKLNVGELVNYSAKSSSLQNIISKAIAEKIKDSSDEIAKTIDCRIEYVIETSVLSAGNACII